MSTAGILRPNEVVFYHPLESNFREHTANEVWTGTAASVPGKIGEGNSAVTSSDIAYGATSEFADGADTTYRINPVQVTVLSETSIAVAYKNNNTSAGYGRAGTVSGTAITWGPEVQFASNGAYPGAGRGTHLVTLDSTRVVVSYAISGSGAWAKVGTVSGLDLTWGPGSQYTTYNLDGSSWCIAMSSTRIVVAYRDGSVTGHGMAQAGTVSGLDITFGASSTFNTTNGNSSRQNIRMARLTDSKFILLHFTGTGSVIGTVSGLDITWGPTTTITMPAGSVSDVAALSATKVVWCLGSSIGYARVGTISGLDITWGPQTVYNNSTVNQNCVVALSSTQVIASYRDYSSSGRGTAVLGTVSGTEITWGTEARFCTDSTVEPYTAKLTATKFVHAYNPLAGTDLGSGMARIGTLDTAADISGTTGLYPSAIADTRVAVAFWCKNPTSGSTEITVERGYAVTLTSSKVSLGGTTAEWTVALGLDDNSDHLVVLDFENTSGTDWNLRTSVDGAAFTNQGAQDGGTSQAVTTADTAPNLTIANGVGGTDQWIDELVMWSGDKAAFERFTSEELANLNDLADTFGETMEKYEENYGAPICWQATATMPDGTVWRDAGCGPCPPVIRVPRGAADIVVTDEGRQVHPRVQEG